MTTFGFPLLSAAAAEKNRRAKVQMVNPRSAIPQHLLLDLIIFS